MPLNSQHPLTPYCGDVLNNVTFTYPINPTSKCDKFRIKSTKVGVFIGVISSPEDFDKRNAVRQTWASMTRSQFPNVTIDYSFVIGSTHDAITQAKITEESRTHGDVIQMELTDSQENLTLKTVALLHWTKHYCDVGMDFIVKVNDNVYVNTFTLAQTVLKYQTKVKAVYGWRLWSSAPVRTIGTSINY